MNNSPSPIRVRLLLIAGLLLALSLACGLPWDAQDQDENETYETETYSETLLDEEEDAAPATAPEPDTQEPDAPAEPEPDTPQPPTDGPLAGVSHWFYYLDVNLDEDTIDAIEASTYDMVVIDFIPSEANNTDFPMAEVVETWHSAAHPKLVIAYIDIGQAEDYRTYWQPGWEIGDPHWIVSGDPDGWEGNYPAAYWWEGYQSIWLGQDGLLQGILDAGFDGIYLDWVEAYSDESIIAKAEADGVDPRQQMINWVRNMAAFSRAQDPDFIVIGQNAAELVESDQYVAAIDAISQEQTWFDGGANNDPPGDCPLPRSDDDIETEAYEDSLNRACFKLYEEYPDSTLHVSSEEYLTYLELARAQGLTVFTVDYALESNNIAWVYETSRSYGFIPFTSNRPLNQYIEPVP
jgi:cysteinyl-tRNA synthetase, unknown class